MRCAALRPTRGPRASARPPLPLMALSLLLQLGMTHKCCCGVPHACPCWAHGLAAPGLTAPAPQVKQAGGPPSLPWAWGGADPRSHSPNREHLLGGPPVRVSGRPQHVRVTACCEGAPWAGWALLRRRSWCSRGRGGRKVEDRPVGSAWRAPGIRASCSACAMHAPRTVQSSVTACLLRAKVVRSPSPALNGELQGVDTRPTQPSKAQSARPATRRRHARARTASNASPVPHLLREPRRRLGGPVDGV